MRRKVVVGVVVVVVAVAIWLLWRGGGAPNPEPGRHPRSSVVATSATPARQAANRPRRAHAWRDEDPPGALQLEGQVIGPDGKGVGGAQVTLSVVPQRTTVTDADGSFAFDKLLTGAYEVSATSGDRIGGPLAYRLTDHSDPVVIRLAEGAAVVVTVVDEAGRPIVGAAVHLEHGLPDRTIATDERGVVRIAPVQINWLLVDVSAPSYGPAVATAKVGSPGSTAELTVTLRRGVAVSGRVLDEAGQPIAGAEIMPIDPEAQRLGDAATTTNERGEYVIAALAPGSYWLRAVDGEHEPARSAALTVADQPLGPVDIVMRSGGVVTGVVVDLAQRPVPSARVHLLAPTSSVGAWRSAIADEGGRFELRGLVRDRLKASADAAGATGEPIDVDLVTHARAELRLVLDNVQTIEGIVVDEHGVPVPEVQVQAHTTTEGAIDTRVTMTVGGGRFVMRGLADGVYRLSVVRRPGGPITIGGSDEISTRAHTGDKDVRLTLATPGRVIGTVVVAGSSAAPSDVMVMLAAAFTTAARDGSFRLEDATVGTSALFLHSPDFADFIVPGVKVERGKTTDLGTITVPRGRTLVGKIVDAAGAPVAGAKVRLDRPELPLSGSAAASYQLDQVIPLRSAETDRDGAFTLPGVPAFATQVMASEPARGRSDAVAVAAGKDDPPPVTLTVKRR